MAEPSKFRPARPARALTKEVKRQSNAMPGASHAPNNSGPILEKRDFSRRAERYVGVQNVGVGKNAYQPSD